MRASLMNRKPIRDPAEVPVQKLTDFPKHRAVAAEYAAIEARIREAVKRQRVGAARNRGQQSTISILDRAKALIAGGQVIASSPSAEVEAATEEIEILLRARSAKGEELAAVAGEIFPQACSPLVEINADGYRMVLDGLTLISEGLNVGRVVRSRLIIAGHTTLNDVYLPTHQFPAAAALGSPDDVGRAPAWFFKQWLIEKGII
jgi:hypothetical protein